MADVISRNRANVLTGAPNIKVMGGMSIGAVVTDPANYPTNAKAAYPTALAMKPAGFIGEDGITKTVDRSTEKIKDWNGDTVLITQSDHSVTLKFTFLESANLEVLKMIAGENSVSETNGVITVKESAEELPHRSFGIDINGGGGSMIRLFASDAQVTEVGDVTYARSDIVKYEVTVECFGDKNGDKLFQFIERAQAATTTTSS